METTRTFLPLLFPLVALACGPSSVASSPPTVPVNDSGVSHAEVEPAAPTPSPAKAAPPELAALVATLVETGEVTSAGVGYSGDESDSYAAYEALADAASLEQLRALLSHPSPIVRAYVGAHLAEHDGASLPQLAVALEDGTSIEAQYGCLGTRATVASHVAREVCYVRDYLPEHRSEAVRLLQGAAQDPRSPSHDVAKRCLSRSIPPPVVSSKP